MATYAIDMKQLVTSREMTIHVKIHRLKEWRWRLWLGRLLIKLAAWVMWMDVEFEGVDEDDGNDL